MMMIDQQNIICQCEDLTIDRYVGLLKSNPAMTFEQALVSTGAAKKCTACLLDMEMTYIDVTENDVVNIRGTGDEVSIAQASNPTKKKITTRIHEALDTFLPPIKPKRTAYLAVVYGKKIRPFLAYSNDLFLYTDREAVCDLRVKVVFRSANGRIVGKLDVHTPPGEHERISLESFYEKVATETVSFGHCEIRYKRSGDGWTGTFRPNIVIESPAGVSTLHGTKAVTRPEILTTWINSGGNERTFVAVVNLSIFPTEFELSYPYIEGVKGASEVPTTSRKVRGRSSAMIELDSAAFTKGHAGGIIVTALKSPLRKILYWFVYATPDLDALSIDHPR